MYSDDYISTLCTTTHRDNNYKRKRQGKGKEKVKNGRHTDKNKRGRQNELVSNRISNDVQYDSTVDEIPSGEGTSENKGTVSLE
jgi:hypothetical protein